MRYVFSLLLLCLLVTPAYAAFEGPGTTPEVLTVEMAKKAADDTACVLEGFLIEKLPGHDDKYTFKDSTGSITVDIDNDIFAGRKVTPEVKVRLFGEVDKELIRANEVDVDRLELL